MKFAENSIVQFWCGFWLRYALQSLCDCTENCIRALLGGPFAELSNETKEGKPHENAVRSLERVAEVQG